MSTPLRALDMPTRRVFIDGRSVGLTTDTAEQRMQDALRRHDQQLDEVLIIFRETAADAISWPHG